jgi:predicted DNA-binding protein with PD1-like motif
MIRSKILHLALAVVCASAASAHAQASPKLEKNPAPHMQVQVLNRSSQETTYAVIFGRGDEVMAGLTEFAQQRHLGASRITGIGGIDNATVGYLHKGDKRHTPIPINQQCEVLSLLGDIALFHNKPVVHIHMVVGLADGSTRGGHLLNARVWPTMEVIVTEYPNTMHKRLDPETGMAFIDPSAKQ